jgi:hypothetical protein
MPWMNGGKRHRRPGTATRASGRVAARIFALHRGDLTQSMNIAAKRCPPSTQPERGANHDADRCRRRGAPHLRYFCYCSIVIVLQSTWQSTIGGNLIIHLHQNCWSIIHLQFCYSIPSQILTGCYSKLILKFCQCHWWPYFSSRAHWQPNFKLNYLLFLYGTNAQSLKQSYTPNIAL